MNCPRCGSEVELYGLPAGGYGPSFKCYTCSPYGLCYTIRTREAYEACDQAKTASLAATEDLTSNDV